MLTHPRWLSHALWASSILWAKTPGAMRMRKTIQKPSLWTSLRTRNLILLSMECRCGKRYTETTACLSDFKTLMYSRFATKTPCSFSWSVAFIHPLTCMCPWTSWTWKPWNRIQIYKCSKERSGSILRGSKTSTLSTPWSSKQCIELNHR